MLINKPLINKIFVVIFVLAFSSKILSEINALGQEITVLDNLNQIELESTAIEQVFALPTSSLWLKINNGYKLKYKKTKKNLKKIKKYEVWYSERPEYMERMLERSNKYLYFVAQEVEKRNMPMEIALLPMIESAYNPIAKSNKKAVGLWQFIASTGKIYGLKRNWWGDERQSVVKSTDAALNYLEKLYNQFNSWELALAAYNAGEGRVARAIKNNQRRKKATDYYSLKLPRETRNYVPKLIAIRNIIQNPSKFNIYLPKIRNSPYFSKVKIPDEIDTYLIPKFAEISIEEFQLLNAEHKRRLIKSQETSQYVLLPNESVEIFNLNLYSYEKPLASWKAYKPKRGERIKKVAKKFKVDEKLIKKINYLKGRKTFRRNSIVLIPIKGAITTEFALNQKTLINYNKIITHHISAGDTLSYISKKYQVSIRYLMEFNELDSHTIIIGTTIDIPLI